MQFMVTVVVAVAMLVMAPAVTALWKGSPTSTSNIAAMEVTYKFVYADGTSRDSYGMLSGVNLTGGQLAQIVSAFSGFTLTSSSDSDADVWGIFIALVPAVGYVQIHYIMHVMGACSATQGSLLALVCGGALGAIYVAGIFQGFKSLKFSDLGNR